MPRYSFCTVACVRRSIHDQWCSLVRRIFRRSISMGYSVEDVTYWFETDSTAWKSSFSRQVQIRVDLIRFEGVRCDLRLKQRTPRLPGSRDDDDPIWAQWAFKLERDLDESFELPGGCSQGFEQRMTELRHGSHDGKECRRQPSFLGLDS